MPIKNPIHVICNQQMFSKIPKKPKLKRLPVTAEYCSFLPNSRNRFGQELVEDLGLWFITVLPKSTITPECYGTSYS